MIDIYYSSVPFLLVLLVVICFTTLYFPESCLILVKNSQATGVIRLCFTTILAAITFWFPVIIPRFCDFGPDSRFGFIFIYMIPFWLLGAVIAIIEISMLIKGINRGQRPLFRFIKYIGIFLTICSTSPIILAIYNMVR
jgi:hypothetical protein